MKAIKEEKGSFKEASLDEFIEELRAKDPEAWDKAWKESEKEEF